MTSSRTKAFFLGRNFTLHAALFTRKIHFCYVALIESSGRRTESWRFMFHTLPNTASAGLSVLPIWYKLLKVACLASFIPERLGDRKATLENRLFLTNNETVREKAICIINKAVKKALQCSQAVQVWHV